ncbi:hypothetical protein VUJ46_12500 [Chryseobacterium sp. MYb264]|uniref:hypothetical protein n=1 Tax=Chryseobacterium sp. MYb264 TaxID=2745153 RepID=UPI002E0F8977|nr:hypothetical protein VUJ46_12500 [Chryseobacterium sp. MYb264]
MKKLNVSQMENLQGGISQRQCLLAAVGLLGTVGLSLWEPAIGIAVASADCW